MKLGSYAYQNIIEIEVQHSHFEKNLRDIQELQCYNLKRIYIWEEENKGWIMKSNTEQKNGECGKKENSNCIHQ